MNKLEEFMKQNKPTGKKSKLAPFENDIMKLNKAGYSARDTVKFLADVHHLHVAESTVCLFIRTHRDKQTEKAVGKKVAAQTNKIEKFEISNKTLDELV